MTTPTPTPEVTSTSTPKLTRDAIRTAILDSKGETKIVNAFGVSIEVRTPNLEDLLQYRNAEEDENIMARAVINNCYVPGTDERIFDEADVPAFMKLAWSPDMKKLQKEVTAVLGNDDAIVKGIEDDTKRATA